jgi:hypothetical protein
MKVYVGQTVLYTLQNGEVRPALVTEINEQRNAIDATLFNNTDKGDHPNGRLLTNIAFDEQKNAARRSPNTWHFIDEQEQSRGQAAGSSR